MSGNAAVDIANIALISIGQDPITSLELTDQRAVRVVNERYDNIRDALLRRYKWNFATIFATIPGAELPAAQFGFKYRSPLPSGASDAPLPWCLRVWQLESASAKWQVKRRYLYTDIQPPITMEYTFRETVVANYDPLFQEMFGATIGILLLNSLATQEARRRVRALQDLLDGHRREARRADAMEQSPDQLARGSKGSWLDSRIV